MIIGGGICNSRAEKIDFIFSLDTRIYFLILGLVSHYKKIIAIGIEQFLERIIESKGEYYFDDPDFVPDVSLDVVKE